MTASQREPVKAPPSPTLVLGLGNILMRDEGLGVHVVRELEAMNLPACVEVFDGATAGMDLLDVIANRRRLIVIDAMDTNDPPGTVRRMTPADLAPSEPALSLHDLGLLETLLAARQLGVEPAETTILGVKPCSVDVGLDLSDEIAGAIPRIIELVLLEAGVRNDPGPEERG